MACTATATVGIAAQIAGCLGMRAPRVVASRRDRRNLRLEVKRRSLGSSASLRQVCREVLALALAQPGRRAPEKDALLVAREASQGLVYCPTRSECERVAAALGEHLGCSAVACYHAGMGAEERAGVAAAFAQGQVRLVVGTVAFSMGIDHRAVRFVVHAGCPASPLAYMQEIGRAGRDGQPARCVLLAGEGDLGRAVGHAGGDEDGCEGGPGWEARAISRYCDCSCVCRRVLLRELAGVVGHEVRTLGQDEPPSRAAAVAGAGGSVSGPLLEAVQLDDAGLLVAVMQRDAQSWPARECCDVCDALLAHRGEALAAAVSGPQAARASLGPECPAEESADASRPTAPAWNVVDIGSCKRAVVLAL